MTRPSGLMALTALWVFNSLLRVLFGAMGAMGTPLLDVEVSKLTIDLISMMCLSLGFGGLVMTIGLWQMKKWGLCGVLVISFITVIFDIWGYFIQFTAAMGLIVPVLTILYMMRHWGNDLWR